MEHKKYHRKINSTKAPKNLHIITNILCNNTSLDLFHVGHVRNATNNTDYS